MKRFFFITSACILSATSVVLFGGSSAHASSPYDNVFSVADNITLNHMQAGSPSRDYSLDWASEAIAAAQAKCDRIGGQSCQDAIDLNNLTGSTAQDDNDWAVFVDPSHNFYTIVYTTTPNTGTTSWIQSGGDYYLEFGSTAYNSIRSINIYYWPEGYDHSENGSYAGISSGSGISVNGGYPVFLSTFPIDYPDGYEGDIIPETYAPIEQKKLRPDYTWKVSAAGDLTITYANNIEPTLTGFVYPVIEKMNNDWEGIESNLQANEGWRMQNFNQSFALPSAGYYMFRMDYDDTFESPPWEQNAHKLYDVDPMWVQFYWDGHSAIAGTTIGCEEGTICNDKKDPPRNYFLGIKIPDHGLSAVITAPLTFISNLSSASCSPITLPLPGDRDITLQCLRPLYEQHAATLFAIWQTVITGAVAYLVAVNTFAKIKVISNPKDDSIEVYKL